MIEDPLAAAKASGFQIIRSPKGAAPQPPARPTPAPTSRPATSTRYAAVPAVMREAKRWVTWQYEIRDGKKTKVPHTPGKGQAKST
uniref:hypothetical protein n=1 Tax=uncultured Methanoculleus sp. TaxID=183762 RepID=UPI003204B8ED